MVADTMIRKPSRASGTVRGSSSVFGLLGRLRAFARDGEDRAEGADQSAISSDAVRMIG